MKKNSLEINSTPSLFSEPSQALPKDAPLSVRMRPQSLEEFVGQKHILGEGKLLTRAIESDRVSSLILYGPPGTGKTTLAHCISQRTRAHFERVKDRKSTRLNSSHSDRSRMPSSA